jgi:uncharacterized glyoxalase superfamily protein PhnB
MNETHATQSCVTVSMSYRDAPAAIEWLCKVFGFKKHAIYPGPDDTIAHSELTFGGGMIMIGSWQNNAQHQFVKLPEDVGGAGTHSINLIVKDADEVCERARAAGAEILFDIEDKPYGGRGFTCRDPEGHIWHVGTYDPWLPK